MTDVNVSKHDGKVRKKIKDSVFGSRASAVQNLDESEYSDNDLVEDSKIDIKIKDDDKKDEMKIDVDSIIGDDKQDMKIDDKSDIDNATQINPIDIAKSEFTGSGAITIPPIRDNSINVDSINDENVSQNIAPIIEERVNNPTPPIELDLTLPNLDEKFTMTPPKSYIFSMGATESLSQVKARISTENESILKALSHPNNTKIMDNSKQDNSKETTVNGNINTVNGDINNNIISGNTINNNIITHSPSKKHNLLMKNNIMDFVKQFIPSTLEIEKMDPDGNCMYRGVSFKLFGNSDFHENIREYIQNFIFLNQDKYGDYLGCTPHFYWIEGTTLGTWGGYLELEAASKIWDITINVYDLQDRILYQIKSPKRIILEENRENKNIRDNSQIIEEKDAKQENIISLAYSNGSHYDAVIFADGVYEAPLFDTDKLGDIAKVKCTLDNITNIKLREIKDTLSKTKMSLSELKKMDRFNLSDLHNTLHNKLSNHVETLCKLYQIQQPSYVNIFKECDKAVMNNMKGASKTNKNQKFKQQKLKYKKKIIKYSLPAKIKIEKMKKMIKDSYKNVSKKKRDNNDGITMKISPKKISKVLPQSQKEKLNITQIITFLDAQRKLLSMGYQDGMYIFGHIYNVFMLTSQYEYII